MSSVSLHQFLVLYTWFPLAALLLFLLLIARFYQKFSGVRTYYWGFLFPVTGMGAAAVHMANADVVRGDGLSALLLASSGLILLLLVVRLYYRMLVKRL